MSAAAHAGPDANHSVAHGAGRKMSRADALRRGRVKHTVEELRRTPVGSLVVCGDRQLLFEEAPTAYKRIEQVIADLVEHRLATPVVTTATDAVGAVALDLPRREFELLHLLPEERGQVLERERIYQQVWGYAMAHGDRSVDVFIRKLRKKIEAASARWTYIHTHFGIGYRFEPEPAGIVAEELRPAPAEPQPERESAPDPSSQSVHSSFTAG